MVFKSRYPDVKPDEKYKDLVSNFFWAQLDKFKSNLLFVDHSTGREWTGAQIKESSARLARQLIKHGLKPEEECVMFYKHCDYTQLTALGILFAGGSLCVGHPLDPEHEHAYMLEVTRPTFVFVTHKLTAEMIELNQRHSNYTIVLMDDDLLDDEDFARLTTLEDNLSDESVRDTKRATILGLHRDLLRNASDKSEAVTDNVSSSNNLPVQVDPNRPAFILLTSGSTGLPKPVSRSQRNSLYVCHSFMGAEDLWDLNENSVVAAHLALDHGTGIFLLKQCLAHGYKSVIINEYELEVVLDAIEAYGVTDMVLGSALVHNLLSSSHVEGALSPTRPDGSEEVARLRKRLGSLRNLVAVGSSIASKSVVDNFMRRLPDCSVRQAYGTTETGFQCFVPRQWVRPELGKNLPTEVVGLAMPNVELKLIDRQPAAEVGNSAVDDEGAGREIGLLDGEAHSEKGELYLRGPTVSPGYVGERYREQARLSFLPDGFYKTGDLCSIGSDGLLRVFGRFNEVLCLGDGYKVLPHEIEEVIMGHPLVKEAAVVGIPNPALLTCHAPRAYVVVREGVQIVDDVSKAGDGDSGGESAVSEQSIIDFVAGRMAEPKHLVGGVKFVSKLPRLSIGKVDKLALKRADGY